LLLAQGQVSAGFWRQALRPDCSLHEVLA